jgi:preprotein translocase subunit YajC
VRVGRRPSARIALARLVGRGSPAVTPAPNSKHLQRSSLVSPPCEGSQHPSENTLHAYLLASQPAGVPGQQTTGAPAATGAPPPATTTSTQASDAPPQQPPGGCAGLGGNGMLLMFALPLLLMFMMSRSQSKKQKELESGLKVGDRVITRAGAVGKLVEVGERLVKLELAPGVNVQFLKTSIEGVDTGDPKDPKKDPKKDDGKDSKDAKKDDAKDAKKDDAKDAKKDK